MVLDAPSPIVALVAGYGCAAVGSAGIAGYAVSERGDEPTARAFAAFALAVAVWSVGSIGWVIAPTVDEKLAWNLLRYVGVLATPVAWLCFTLYFTGNQAWMTPRFVASLSILPVAAWLALASNASHFQFYDDVVRVNFAGWPLVDVPSGPVFLIQLAYGYALFLGGLGLLVRHALHAPRPYRRQTRVLVVVAFVTWLVNVAFVVGLRPYELFDLTPIGFGVGAVVLAVAVFRIRFLDLVPVAREGVLERIDDAVIVADGDGRIVDANAAAVAHFDDETFVGRPAREALPPPILDVMAGDVRDEEIEIRLDVEGEPAWFLARAFPVSDDARRGRIVVLTDVTELRRHRRQLERKNEQLEGLADVVSHDLRSPLSAIRGNLRILRQEFREGATWSATDAAGADDDRTGPGSAREHIELMGRSVDRIDQLANDLVVLARQGKRVDVDGTMSIETVARRAWETVDTGDLVLVVDADATVAADGSRLRQLFENCYRNVADHARSAETVRVGAITGSGGGEADETDESEEADGTDESEEADGTDESEEDDGTDESEEDDGTDESEEADGTAESEEADETDESEEADGTGEIGGTDGTAGGDFRGFYVEDDGHGVPPDRRESVFEYGHSGPEGGTGLGLAIVHEIATAHGWRVDVVDGRTGGARFEFEAPP